MGRRARLVAVLACAALTVLTGCTGTASTAPSAPPPWSSSESSAGPATGTVSPQAITPMDLSLLVFNVEYGGSRASDAVIRDLDADVVSVLESYDRLPVMAAAAGYPYYDYGLQILSKYPILEPSGADGLYALIEVRPGQAVALVNTHLDYVEYGPRRLLAGVPEAEVLATEDRVRTSSIDKLLPSVRSLLAQGWPVLLTGDLNEPSHLDWTAGTAGRHGGYGPVAWPVSLAVTSAGLGDVYRSAHPDPLAEPGSTWGDVAGARKLPARIDFAYAGGPVQVRASEVVGERGAPVVDRGFPRWTSDHRAVLSQLRITPSAIPTTVALSTRLADVGDPITVTYRLPDGVMSGSVEVTGNDDASYPVTGASGTVQVPTAAMAPGSYQVSLVAGGSPVADNEFSLRSPHATVRLSTDEPSYGVGDPVTVSWVDGPANRWDWIGVFRADAARPTKDDYLLWGYTGGHDAGALPPTTSGSMVLGPDSQGNPWPLPPGRYVVHYLLSDQYASAGSTTFVVRR